MTTECLGWDPSGWFERDIFHYVGREQGLATVFTYPRAPGPAIAQAFPRESTVIDAVNRFTRSLEEEAQKGIGEASTPLHFFRASEPTVAEFIRSYNGAGIDKLALWLMDALATEESTLDLLAEAVEGGLISTLQYFRQPGQRRIPIDQSGESVLLAAFKRRLPRIPKEAKERLSNTLLSELKEELIGGRSLLVDRAVVRFHDGCIVGELTASSDDSIGQVEGGIDRPRVVAA